MISRADDCRPAARRWAHRSDPERRWRLIQLAVGSVHLSRSWDRRHLRRVAQAAVTACRMLRVFLRHCVVSLLTAVRGNAYALCYAMEGRQMSTATFDRLYKQGKLRQARESLREWEKSRARTDLTAEDIAFLDRAIVSAKETIKRREQALREWWT